LARHAAGDVEVAVFFVLSALRNREVLLEQPNATLLRALASNVGVHAPSKQGGAGIVVALLGPPFQQSALRFLPARGLVCPAANCFGRVAGQARLAPSERYTPPQAIEECGGHASPRTHAGHLRQMLLADAPVDLMRLD